MCRVEEGKGDTEIKAMLYSRKKGAFWLIERRELWVEARGLMIRGRGNRV